MKNEFKGSKKSYAQWNYNDAPPNIVLTYLLYKYGEADFKQLLDDVFAKKVRIGDEILTQKNGTARSDEKSLMHMFFTTSGTRRGTMVLAGTSIERDRKKWK